MNFLFVMISIESQTRSVTMNFELCDHSWHRNCCVSRGHTYTTLDIKTKGRGNWTFKQRHLGYANILTEEN
jgi:hypothetical protein